MYFPRIKIPLLHEGSKKTGHKRAPHSNFQNLPPDLLQKCRPTSAEPQARTSRCGREQSHRHCRKGKEERQTGGQEIGVFSISHPETIS